MIPAGLTIYVATTAVDLRAGFDRLAGLVLEKLGGDPRSGSLFLFTNRRRTHLKALFFDRTGYCILYKRLDRGTFPMPTVTAFGSSQTEISSGELALILEGLAPLSGSRLRARRAPEEIAKQSLERMSTKKDEPSVH
jgi:transposase